MSNPALAGSLSSFRLPEVLTFLNTTNKTGTLTLAHDADEAYLFFEGGDLIYAGTNQERLRLGALLLRKRKINKDQCERINELIRSDGGRFGQRAVDEKIITDDQLRDALKIQVSEILYDCFVWPAGRFTFGEEMDLPPYAVTIAVDLSNLIMEGARRIEEWEQCVRLLPNKKAVFRVVSNPEKEEKITLTREEWKVLFLINGQRTLEELCLESDDDPFQVYRIVYGLLSNALIEEVQSAPVVDTVKLPTAHSEETFRQPPANFGGDSTVREPPDEPPLGPDDTNLLISSDARLSYRDVVKPTVAQLTIVNGEGTGTAFPLTEPEYLVGRHRDNSIQIGDLGISGFHARIYRGPEGYVIEDMKSRNGVWLNGTRVFHALLTQGDTLRLGSTELRFNVLYDG